MTVEVGLRFVVVAVGRDDLYEAVYGPVPNLGAWLADYDPDADDGRGRWEFSDDPSLAMRFASTFAAIACWRTATSRPVRLDGKPNRPLTCLTVITSPLDAIADRR